MAFIETIPPERAEGLLAELYADDVRKHGFVPNYSRAWSLRPEVLAAWRALLAAIRSRMDPRRYELVTIVAAAKLRCTY
jgi:alkylhydroperoxidase family enzyme